MSGNTGQIVATYHHSGLSNTDITGSNGQVFFLKRPFLQWRFQWELYGGGRKGTLLYTATNPGGMFSSKPDFFLQDMQGGEVTIEMKRRSNWNPTELTFMFSDRTYVWIQSWKGYWLNAVDEDGIDKGSRTIFAKFKTQRKVIIYEVGLRIPPQVIILTGFIAEHLYQRRASS